MNKNSQKEYYINVLTFKVTKYILKVVGARPFEKRLAPIEKVTYKVVLLFSGERRLIFLCFYLLNQQLDKLALGM